MRPFGAKTFSRHEEIVFDLPNPDAGVSYLIVYEEPRFCDHKFVVDSDFGMEPFCQKCGVPHPGGLPPAGTT